MADVEDVTLPAAVISCDAHTHTASAACRFGSSDVSLHGEVMSRQAVRAHLAKGSPDATPCIAANNVDARAMRRCAETFINLQAAV